MVVRCAFSALKTLKPTLKPTHNHPAPHERGEGGIMYSGFPLLRRGRSRRWEGPFEERRHACPGTTARLEARASLSKFFEGNIYIYICIRIYLFIFILFLFRGRGLGDLGISLRPSHSPPPPPPLKPHTQIPLHHCAHPEHIRASRSALGKF